MILLPFHLRQNHIPAINANRLKNPAEYSAADKGCPRPTRSRLKRGKLISVFKIALNQEVKSLERSARMLSLSSIEKRSAFFIPMGRENSLRNVAPGFARLYRITGKRPVTKPATVVLKALPLW